MLGAVVVTSSSLMPLIESISKEYGVDPLLTKAFIKVESDFVPTAQRYEPRLKDSSWGLMQVLLTTAREILNRKDLSPSELLKPEVNIRAGVAYIAKQLKRYSGNIHDSIAAYNAGTARRIASGKYANQAYVDKVIKWYYIYKGLGPAVNVGTVVGIGLALSIIVYSSQH